MAASCVACDAGCISRVIDCTARVTEWQFYCLTVKPVATSVVLAWRPSAWGGHLYRCSCLSTYLVVNHKDRYIAELWTAALLRGPTASSDDKSRTWPLLSTLRRAGIRDWPSELGGGKEQYVHHLPREIQTLSTCSLSVPVSRRSVDQRGDELSVT